MKKKSDKRRLECYNMERGMERRHVMEQGGVWIRPTMYMEMKTKYNRSRNKKELRREMQF